MDNEFFLNTGHQKPAVNFEPPSTSSATILNWPYSMEIQPPEQLNLNRNSMQDCFFWEKSTEQSIFDSALSSLVSSPTASNSNFSGGGGGGGDSFIIRELIGKLGNIGNRSGEIYGTPTSNGKCYATPMSFPPNIPTIAAKTTPLADFSGDPGFAERAARFSRFGSRSFNGRNTSAFPTNNVNVSAANAGVRPSGKLPRVSSTPSLKPQICNRNARKNPNIINEESNVSGQHIPGGDSPAGEFSRKRKSIPKGKSKEISPSTASPSPNSSKASQGNEDSDRKKRSKVSEDSGKKEAEGSATTKTATVAEEEEEGDNGDEEAGSNTHRTNTTKPPEPPKDYIHVRARRGQATDSHSLAERVRREKISERMKLLQDLVPGCNKVTGKALMLDEIINYVQSLQRQVELLSMKLASVNTSSLDYNVDDALSSKDIIQQSINHPMHHQTYFAHQPQENNNVTFLPNVPSNRNFPQPPLNPIDTSNLTRSFSTHLPSLSQFTDPTNQYPTFCEDDLQSIVQMGFPQNLIRETEPIQSQIQTFQSSNQASHMKIEI